MIYFIGQTNMTNIMENSNIQNSKFGTLPNHHKDKDIDQKKYNLIKYQ